MAIDCLDLPESMNHRKHVIVAVDVFTRYVFGKAIENLKATCSVIFLLEAFGRYGVPENILTDNAPIFCNEQTRELASKYNFVHRTSTPHHHQGNAVAERMIQTVQEKLSILVHQREVDWDMVLSLTFLSINTAVCASTGFSPYELLFWRKFELLRNQFEFTDSVVAAYLKDAPSKLQRNHKQAMEKQLENKKHQKTLYGAARSPPAFERGDAVMARRMGRLDKLADRWEGHHLVENRTNDVYKLRHQITNKLIERHLQDMKSYRGLVSYLVAAVMAVGQSAFLVFDRAPPILLEETQKFVSSGFVHLRIRLAFSSLCQILYDLGPQANEVQQAVVRCESIYKNSIVDEIAKMSSRAPIDLGNDKQDHMRGPDQQIQPTLPVPNQLGQNGQHMPIPGSAPYPRHPFPVAKRDLTSMGVYATFLFCSNLISKVIDSHWTNPAVMELHDRTERIRDVLIELTQKQNLTMFAVEAVQEAVVNQATLIHHNLAEINRIAYSHPELMVVSAHIISRIVSVGSQLDLLEIGFRSKRPNLELLSSLTDTALLGGADQDTIPRQSVLIEAINEEVFEVRFSARQRDSTTSV